MYQPGPKILYCAGANGWKDWRGRGEGVAGRLLVVSGGPLGDSSYRPTDEEGTMKREPLRVAAPPSEMR